MTQPNPLQSTAPAVGATAVPTTEYLSEVPYETRHRELRQALATTPSNAPFPSIALQNALDFEHRTAEPLDELVAAARRLATLILDGLDREGGGDHLRGPDRGQELHAAGFLLGKLILLDEASR